MNGQAPNCSLTGFQRALECHDFLRLQRIIGDLRTTIVCNAEITLRVMLRRTGLARFAHNLIQKPRSDMAAITDPARDVAQPNLERSAQRLDFLGFLPRGDQDRENAWIQLKISLPMSSNR